MVTDNSLPDGRAPDRGARAAASVGDRRDP